MQTSDQPPTHLLSWHPSSTTADIAEDHKNMPFFLCTFIKISSMSSYDNSNTSLPPGSFEDTLASVLKNPH